MKVMIKDLRENGKVEFEYEEVGDYFEDDDAIYVKVDESTAWNLTDGRLDDFERDERVTPISDVEITIR